MFATACTNSAASVTLHSIPLRTTEDKAEALFMSIRLSKNKGIFFVFQHQM